MATRKAPKGASVGVAEIAALLSDPSVERKAAAAIVLGALGVFGPDVEEGLKGLLESGVPALERPALDAVLAELGGKRAFSTLLDGLLTSDVEGARRAALQVRHHLKDAKARERKSLLKKLHRFLAREDVDKSPPALAAAMKILGYLEDEEAIPTLVAYAQDEARHPMVRQEAVIGLRFALSQGAAKQKVIEALLDVAAAEDRGLARTALDTLGLIEVPDALMPKLASLASHPDLARAAHVIRKLGEAGGDKAQKALVEIVKEGGPRSAEMAADALAGKEDAAPLFAKALLETESQERALLLQLRRRRRAQEGPHPRPRGALLRGLSLHRGRPPPRRRAPLRGGEEGRAQEERQDGEEQARPRRARGSLTEAP